MRNWVIALIVSVPVFCSLTHAALINNPESFEYGDTCFLLPCPPLEDWESWGSGSGSQGWSGWEDQAEIFCGDATDGDCSLMTSVGSSVYWGYTLAFNHGTPIVPGQIYEYFFDYKSVGGGDAVFKLELYDPNDVQLDVIAWDPYPVPTPDVWHHFSYIFRAPDNAAFVSPVVGATGAGGIMLYDMLGILPADCPYELEGDEDGDCRVTLNDFALLAANWLIDCIDDPTDPACIVR